MKTRHLLRDSDTDGGPSGRRSAREIARIGALLALLVAGLTASGLLERVNSLIYDQLARAGQHAPNPHILIVAIDQKSLQALGRWPWSRRVHAAFLDRLASAGDNTVALDLLLAEGESDSAPDAALADSIRNHGSVILPVVPVAQVNGPGLMSESSLPVFAGSASLAHADIDPDADGVVRRVHLYGGLGAPSWPALGLALMQARAGLAPPAPTLAGPASGQDADVWVRANEVLIPFAGPADTYPHVSYVDVLNGQVAPGQIRGKYIIVGASAAGLGARFATPTTLANRLPLTGAELHANVLDTLLAGRAITEPAPRWTLVTGLLWLAAGMALIPQRRSYRVLLGLAALLVLLLCLTALAAHYLDLWLAPAPALVGLLAIYPAWSWRQLHWHIRMLFRERGQSHATLELVQDGIITLDAAGRARYLNSAAEAITGRPLAEALGRPLDEITGLKPVDPASASALGADGNPMHIATHTLTTRDGSERAVRIARHPLPADGGSVIAITDVTANLAMAQKITHQATHDGLTGLPNRAILSDRLGQLIASARRRNQSAAVLFIDLDGFKKVNDALGHAAGDLLLREVAARLASRIRAEDTVARWGGDEFVILLRRLDDENSVIGFANTIIHLLEEPFDLGGQNAFISASIGVSLFPRDGLEADQLLLRADAAMYRSKKDGGRCVNMFSHEVGAWNRAQLNLENDLRAGLQNGALELVYQPVIDLNHGRLAHMEALVRWQHPTQGELSPERFLALAESSGLIHEIGALVLRTACADARQLASQGLPVGVCVNISPQQLIRGELPELVREVLSASGLLPAQLTLEVTENAIVSDAARAAETIHALRTLGVAIALDDFGTGYSSLSLLRDYPIDILKIDRSFVPNPQDRAGDLTIAHAIIGMARSLDKAVIAEGVETAWQARALLIGGCHLQQGFLHSPPVRVGKIPDVARRIARTGIPALIASY